MESAQATTLPWHATKEVDLMSMMYISFAFRKPETFWFSSATLLYATSVPDLVYNRYELGGLAAILLEDDAFGKRPSSSLGVIAC